MFTMRHKNSLLLATLMMLCAAAQARPIDQHAAMRTARDFWNRHNASVTFKDAELVLMPVEGLNHLYIFGNADGKPGFVIMSADDRVMPVLAYSFDSPFPAQLNAELRYWLEGYESQLAAWDDVPDSAPTASAAPTAGGLGFKRDSTFALDAMCQTVWDQGGRYNAYCPYDSTNNDRTVVGCTATAMAQIMKYWNHPSCGEGTASYWSDYGLLTADFSQTTYMWGWMTNVVNNGTPDYRANAVALLSYHCGLAAKMSYGISATGGSGAHVIDYGGNYPSAQKAFKENFKYRTSLRGEQRARYNISTWKNMIYDDLAARRPILYTGYEENGGGHAFVLDGCDTLDKFHFNWGWSGYGNGFYTIDSLNPGGSGIGGNTSYTFNTGQQALFGIEPRPEVLDTVEVTRPVCYVMNDYQFYEYVLPVADSTYTLVHLDTVFRLTTVIEDGRSVFLSPNGGTGSTVSIDHCVSTSVELPECPFVRSGYYFAGWCLSFVGNGTLYQPGSQFDYPANVTLYAIWRDSATLAIDGVEDSGIQVFPNPASDFVSVALPSTERAEATLFDALGRAVWHGTLASGETQIPLTEQPAGVYLLRVNSQKGVYNERIMKQ